MCGLSLVNMEHIIPFQYYITDLYWGDVRPWRAVGLRPVTLTINAEWQCVTGRALVAAVVPRNIWNKPSSPGFRRRMSLVAKSYMLAHREHYWMWEENTTCHPNRGRNAGHARLDLIDGNTFPVNEERAATFPLLHPRSFAVDEKLRSIVSKMDWKSSSFMVERKVHTNLPIEFWAVHDFAILIAALTLSVITGTRIYLISVIRKSCW